jgi:putative flavoprotein involved in K+ transport
MWWPDTNTIIIGAGQAGLAASRLLAEAKHEHVVLERGRVGERWLSATWDSLRLLSPNWMTRLPHWSYSGAEPDGYMTATEVAAYLAAYGGSFNAPVQAHTMVEEVRRSDMQFEVVTNRETWRAHNLIIATGWSERPAIPPLARNLHRWIDQVTPTGYRNPGQLRDGAVLVVGASATGVQLADELRRAGRSVYLAVGRHSRVPRRYRGRDIFWWLERTGTLSRSIDAIPSPREAPREPSMQLVGRSDCANVDLPTLAAAGVKLLGRLQTVRGATAYFADDLPRTTLAADDKLCRVLARIDRYIEDNSPPERIFPPEPPQRLQLEETIGCLDLLRAGVSTVIWATGYRRDYRWLDIPVLDEYGELEHTGGITRVPGLYALGLRFQRTRRSNFLDGVGADALAITQHLLRRQHPG